MKKTILTLVAFLAVTGCQQVCKESEKLQIQLAELSGKLELNSRDGGAYLKFCQLDDQRTDFLRVAAEKAEKAARHHLSWTEHVCQEFHFERVCEDNPNDVATSGHPVTYCFMEKICERSVAIFHKRAGYDDTLALAQSLRDLRSRTLEGCFAYVNGYTDAGLKKIEEALEIAHSKELEDQELALEKLAGCI